MKRTIFVAAVVAIIIPVSASALTLDEIKAQIDSLLRQVAQLQEQIRVLTASTTPPVACTMEAKICPNGTSVGRVGPRCEFAPCPGETGGVVPPEWCVRYADVEYGSRGENVTALQSAIGKSELGSAPTGYYGKLTQDAFRRRCLPLPIGGLSIQGVSGPTTLDVGEQGTWTVQAVATSTGTLSYRVAWGDEDAFARLASFAGDSAAFVQSATFTHVYQRAGKFTPRFVVRDLSGASAVASITVRVGGGDACPIYNRPECPNGHIVSGGFDENGCQRSPQCVVNTLNCPIPSCAMASPCPTGQHYEADAPVYGAGGCQTNWCAQRCVSDVICAGPLAEGGFVHSQCPVLPIGNTAANGAEKQEPIQGGFADNSKTCAANGMIFAEGASVSQCIASGGANGCNTFSVVEPRFVCRGGAWVQ